MSDLGTGLTFAEPSGNDLQVSPDLFGSPFKPQSISPNDLGGHLSPTVAAVVDPDSMLDTIMKHESAGKNVMNYINDPKHTAGGYWQITNSTWRDIAPRAGVDVGKYPTAISAPYNVQRQAAKQLLAERGVQPWADFNPALARAIGYSGPGTVQVEPTSNDLAAKLGPGVPPASPPTGDASAPTLLGGQWNKLLALAMLGQQAQFKPVQVKYDPSAGATNIPLVRGTQLGSETGSLPGTSRIPSESYNFQRPLPQAKLQTSFTPAQAPSYITKTGMRDYWSLPEAVSLMSGE